MTAAFAFDATAKPADPDMVYEFPWQLWIEKGGLFAAGAMFTVILISAIFRWIIRPALNQCLEAVRETKQTAQCIVEASSSNAATATAMAATMASARDTAEINRQTAQVQSANIDSTKQLATILERALERGTKQIQGG